MGLLIAVAISVLIVAAVAIVLIIIRKQRKAKEELRLRREEFEKRQAKAQWAKAIVVSVESEIVYGAETQATVSITLDVHPQEASPYRANTRWMVDISVLSSIRQGREIAVKIDASNYKIIYPHASWASYLCE